MWNSEPRQGRAVQNDVLGALEEREPHPTSRRGESAACKGKSVSLCDGCPDGSHDSGATGWTRDEAFPDRVQMTVCHWEPAVGVDKSCVMSTWGR
jgi:hypothetical protein